MSASATKRFRLPRAPLIGAAVCAAAAFVYQLFGHGVYSTSMSLCFLPPLCLALHGALWNGLRSRAMPQVCASLLGAGAATLAVWMFLFGVMEIAGTEACCLVCFAVIGAGECVGGLAGAWRGWRSGKEKNHDIHNQL